IHGESDVEVRETGRGSLELYYDFKQLTRRDHRGCSRLFQTGWDAEDGEESVSEKLVDDPAFCLHAANHLRPKRVQGPNAFARVMRFSISRESAQVRDQNGRWPHFRPVAAWSREEFGHHTGRDVLAEEAHDLSVGGGGRN